VGSSNSTGHRDYSPGDELRYLDWNSTPGAAVHHNAREESGVLHIFIDATSMSLGTPATPLAR
jgi:uncharacterized protein (DUF58 family)